MKFAVLGASGNVGSHVVKQLAADAKVREISLCVIPVGVVR
jgi:uncharacterized protein YbjT (DUF2867 family)